MTSSAASRVAPAPAPYAPAAAQDPLTECLACIVTGRPLPEAHRPAPRVPSACATVGDGIARVIGAPRPA